MYIRVAPTKRKQPSMARNHMFGVRILTFMGFFILLARTMFKNERSVAELQINNSEGTRNSCSLKPLYNKDEIFKFFEKSTRKCNSKASFGSVEVCTDYEFNSGTCIVYTFGLSLNWLFEDAIANKGCKVYTFDPKVGQEDHQRSSDIFFHNLGVSHLRDTINGPYGQGKVCKDCKVDTFRNIIYKLGHQYTPLSLVRLDIGGGVEKTVLAEVFLNSPELLNNVAQLHVTFSNLDDGQLPEFGITSEMVEMWRVIQQLQCAGFILTDVQFDEDKQNKISDSDASKRRHGKTANSKHLSTVWVNKKNLS